MIPAAVGSNSLYAISGSRHWSLILLISVSLIVMFMIQHEDKLYSMYMGDDLPINLHELKTLLENNQNLQSPFNRVIISSQKPLSNKEQLPDNYIVLDSKLKVSIASPFSESIVTSNTMHWYLQGKSLFQQSDNRYLKPIEHLQIHFTLDGIPVDNGLIDKYTHTVAANNKLEFKHTFPNLNSGSHSFEVKVTIPKVITNDSMKFPDQKLYYSTAKVLFFYLDPTTPSPLESVELVTRPGQHPVSKLTRYYKPKQSQHTVSPTSKQTPQTQTPAQPQAPAETNDDGISSTINIPAESDIEPVKLQPVTNIASDFLSSFKLAFTTTSNKADKAVINQKPLHTLQLPLSKHHQKEPPAPAAVVLGAISEPSRILNSHFMKLSLNTVSLSGNNPSNGIIQMRGLSFKHGLRFTFPSVESDVGVDVSVNLDIPIMYIMNENTRVHMVFSDDKYFDLSALVKDNVRIDSANYLALESLLTKEMKKSFTTPTTSTAAGTTATKTPKGGVNIAPHLRLPGTAGVPIPMTVTEGESLEVAIMRNQELLQYCGTFTMELTGLELGTHNVQIIVTYLPTTTKTPTQQPFGTPSFHPRYLGGVEVKPQDDVKASEEIVMSFDAIRMHRKH